MYEGERDHCHSVSAIFSLISSQNFICQLNHCRQTPQRCKVCACVREGVRKMNKKGPFMAISVFCLLKYILFFSYAKVSLKKKKKDKYI